MDEGGGEIKNILFYLTVSIISLENSHFLIVENKLNSPFHIHGKLQINLLP